MKNLSGCFAIFCYTGGIIIWNILLNYFYKYSFTGVSLITVILNEINNKKKSSQISKTYLFSKLTGSHVDEKHFNSNLFNTL